MKVEKCSQEPRGDLGLCGLNQNCGAVDPGTAHPSESCTVSQTGEKSWAPWVQVTAGTPSPDVGLDGQCPGRVGSRGSAVCFLPERTAG